LHETEFKRYPDKNEIISFLNEEHPIIKKWRETEIESSSEENNREDAAHSSATHETERDPLQVEQERLNAEREREARERLYAERRRQEGELEAQRKREEEEQKRIRWKDAMTSSLFTLARQNDCPQRESIRFTKLFESRGGN
jgi:hypothetical protein